MRTTDWGPSGGRKTFLASVHRESPHLPCFSANSTPFPPIFRMIKILIKRGIQCPLNPKRNHLEERLLDQAQARASYTPPFLGGFRVSYPKLWFRMSDPLVKSSFWDRK